MSLDECPSILRTIDLMENFYLTIASKNPRTPPQNCGFLHDCWSSHTTFFVVHRLEFAFCMSHFFQISHKTKTSKTIMSRLSTSFLLTLCLMLLSVIAATQNDLGLSQDRREPYHAAPSPSRANHKDWMSSPVNQRRYNSKYGLYSDASGTEEYFRRRSRGRYHNHEATKNFESWTLNQVKKALEKEREAWTSASSSQSWR